MATTMKSSSADRFDHFVTDGESSDSAFDRLKSTIDNLGTNVLIADTDRNLVYMNRRSEETLRSIANIVQNELGLSVDDLVGGSIDRFHGARTNEIARTLSNPRNLPIKTDIKLGPLTLALEVNAATNDNGECIGFVVNWEEVSKARVAEYESVSTI